MPTTSAPAKMAPTTIRSPSGRRLARPLPVLQATSHDTTWTTAATTMAATTGRQFRARTSHAKIAVQNKVISTCSTRPSVTRLPLELVAVLRSNDAAIAANGRTMLPRRCPMATSAPAVAAATTKPSENGDGDFELTRSFTNRSNSSMKADSSLDRICTRNIFTRACNRPRS